MLRATHVGYCPLPIRPITSTAQAEVASLFSCDQVLPQMLQFHPNSASKAFQALRGGGGKGEISKLSNLFSTQ